MSFILDALKKSEAERQDQAGGEFSSVPTSSATQRSSVWIWLLGGLLAVNLAVLLGILLRPGADPLAVDRRDAVVIETSVQGEVPAPAQAQEMPTQPAETAAPSFAERVASARQNQAAEADTRPVAAEPQAQPDPQIPAASPRVAEPATGALPSIDELRLDGSVQLPDLHVDIHVFSDDPAERFVFINMVKHREGSTLEEGPTVRRITADGAILEYRGRSFLLPRE